MPSVQGLSQGSRDSGCKGQGGAGLPPRGLWRCDPLAAGQASPLGSFSCFVLSCLLRYLGKKVRIVPSLPHPPGAGQGSASSNRNPCSLAERGVGTECSLGGLGRRTSSVGGWTGLPQRGTGIGREEVVKLRQGIVCVEGCGETDRWGLLRKLTPHSLLFFVTL